MEDYIVRGFPKIDSAAVDYDNGAVELDDLIFRHMSFPPDELSAGRVWRLYMAGPLGWPVSAHSFSDWVTPCRITSQTWTMLSLVGSSLSLSWIGSADVPLCRHLLPAVIRSASHEVEIYRFFSLYRHPVWPDGGSVSSKLDMYLYAPLCHHLLSFDSVVSQQHGPGENVFPSAMFQTDSDILLLLLRISQGTGPSIRQTA